MSQRERDVLQTMALMISGKRTQTDAGRLFGRCKQKWLLTSLELSSLIPRHDTFGRVLARLDLNALGRCLMGWMASLVEFGAEGWIASTARTNAQQAPLVCDNSSNVHHVCIARDAFV